MLSHMDKILLSLKDRRIVTFQDYTRVVEEIYPYEFDIIELKQCEIQIHFWNIKWYSFWRKHKIRQVMKYINKWKQLTIYVKYVWG